ncbi:MAG: hypothetical protein IKX88_08730 [Thermoguttaceae bacterium]|nr:hypothetical protein [Thermoguttaceae bacterium]
MNTSIMRRPFLGVLLILTAFVGVGCNSNVQFGGTVTFSDDGSPVTQGVVVFEKGGYMARGALDEKGAYQLGAETLDGGLQKGDYKVYVTGAVEAVLLEPKKDADGNVLNGYEIPDKKPKGAQIIGDRMLTPTVDPKFCEVKTTPLTVTVDGKQKRFDFKVDRNTP